MGNEKKLPSILSLLIIASMAVAVIFFYKKIENNTTPNSIPISLTQSSCLNCHADMVGFAPAHTPDKISCTACHLGHEEALGKIAAHKNMVLIPGNLSNANKTCAKCHPGIDLRVKNSLMNTMSGIVSVDKYVFDENENLDSIFNIHHLKNATAGDIHLRNKCASCHIGREKLTTSPIHEKSRGGGCTACHLNYDKKAKEAHNKYILSEKEDLPQYHPSLSLQVTDNHCFGCHSRSGRISTNYEGWHETTLKKKTIRDFEKYRILEDKRVFIKKEADIHQTKGLSCTDCHDAYDTMGNGATYAHKEDAVNITCRDCHFSTTPQTISFTALDVADQRIVQLKGITKDFPFLYGAIAKKPIINVIKMQDELFLITKNTSKKIAISKPSPNCTKPVHKNVSCSTCHTSWAPQCISCHTSYDDEIPGYDLLARETVDGKWIEKGGNYLAESPTLGIVTTHGKKEVKTFIPGMAMTLQKGKNQTSSFHRYFAPGSAHTISAKGRGCKSCHNNPVALGYGRGELVYTQKGQWKFTSQYKKSEDGLPEDAWIPFLQNDIENKATRKNARPFTLKEQQKILRIGACLTCHEENSTVVKSMLNGFEAVFLHRDTRCKF